MASSGHSTVGGRLIQNCTYPATMRSIPSANINLAIGIGAADPVSGAASHRCCACHIEKVVWGGIGPPNVVRIELRLCCCLQCPYVLHLGRRTQ